MPMRSHDHRVTYDEPSGTFILTFSSTVMHPRGDQAYTRNITCLNWKDYRATVQQGIDGVLATNAELAAKVTETIGPRLQTETLAQYRQRGGEITYVTPPQKRLAPDPTDTAAWQGLLDELAAGGPEVALVSTSVQEKEPICQ